MGKSDEWYTPRHITDALGKFDLDPCAAPDAALHFAAVNYTKADDGLHKQWRGRVFLNPPYSHPLIDEFVKKMAEHKDGGVMLTFNRLDSRLFQDFVLPKAAAMFILRGRVKFSNAKQGGNCGSILTAYSEADAEVLHRCGLKGFFIRLKKT